jgi:hypothetical protein
VKRDDIIRMAQEAKLWDTFDDDSIGALKRFAAIVAAEERKFFLSHCEATFADCWVFSREEIVAAIRRRARKQLK